ncbi:polymer-forming cytoskeletal protein [Myxococcota bacterium]|nr:polymer-forming cytoskeletal protein [Myxococcota bacterium]
MSAANPDPKDPEASDELEAAGLSADPISTRSGVSATQDDVLIPLGGAFEGQVAITGPTRIDGSVRGSLRGAGDLVLGAQSRIEGRVECESLMSEGEIVGPVSVRTRARLGAGARLDGDLQAPIVSLDDDAIWNGRALIGEAPVLEPSEGGMEGEVEDRSEA